MDSIEGGAPYLANKLVNITPISLWFMVDISIVDWGYKPTYNWGAPACSDKNSNKTEGL